MNQYQFRAIRNSLERDVIYCKGAVYNNNLIDFPIMGKQIKDVVILGKTIDKLYHFTTYKLTKGANVYIMHHINYKHISRTIAIITKNDKIIYWNNANIGNDYWPAWRHLTGVYHGYGEGDRSSCWTWISEDDFDCEDIGCFAKELAKNFKLYPDYYLHTEYQKEMFAKTGKYYIDKRIVSKEVIEEQASKQYYHI